MSNIIWTVPGLTTDENATALKEWCEREGLDAGAIARDGFYITEDLAGRRTAHYNEFLTDDDDTRYLDVASDEFVKVPKSSRVKTLPDC